MQLALRTPLSPSALGAARRLPRSAARSQLPIVSAAATGDAKKPGRPKKAAAADGDAAPPAAGEEAPKKKRGRPAKPKVAKAAKGERQAMAGMAGVVSVPQ